MGPGDEPGRFRIEGPLADGSWRARDRRSGAPIRVREVAPYSEAELLAGARALLSFEEAAVLPLADVGVEADGTAWVAEPWQPGETLADRVGRMGPLPPEHLLIVAEGLFAGLAAAHARGIRDGAITPERLRILGDPPHQVLLAQPGLGALLTDLVPDPDFAPPEGATPTVAADLFGAAATLCFAALGTSVPAGQALALAGPKLPDNLLDALRQCLDPDPRDRPHSIEPLKRSVQALRSRAASHLIQPDEAARKASDDRSERRREAPELARGQGATRVGRPEARAEARPASVDAGAETAPPPEPEGGRFEATLAELGGEAPLFDFSADATLPPEPGLDIATLTLPAAPPIPERSPPVEAPDPSLDEPPPRSAPPAARSPEDAGDPFVVPGRAARPRPAPAPTPPSTPPRTLYFVGGGLLVLGLGAVVAWWAMRTPPEAVLHDAGPESVAAPEPAPVSAPATATGPESAPPDRFSYVRVTVEPGPARFVQVPSGVVVCESAEVCNVPIEVPTRVEKAGHRPLVLSGDDLYDRRGGRWRVKLYRGR